MALSSLSSNDAQPGACVILAHSRVCRKTEPGFDRQPDSAQAVSGDASDSREKRPGRCGGGRIRKVLYVVAMRACTYNPHMRAFAERLKANGKKPMEATGAVMRKLRVLIRAVVVSGKSCDPTFGYAV